MIVKGEIFWVEADHILSCITKFEKHEHTMNCCIGAGNFAFYGGFRVFYFFASLLAFLAFFSSKNPEMAEPASQAGFVKTAFIFLTVLSMAFTNFQLAAESVLHVP